MPKGKNGKYKAKRRGRNTRLRPATAKAVKKIVEKAIATQVEPKKMSYPLNGATFATITTGGLTYQSLLSSGVYTVPSVTRLTIIPQNTLGTAAGQHIDTATRFGDCRETTEVLLKAFSIDAHFLLQRYVKTSALPLNVNHRLRVRMIIVRSELPYTTVTGDAQHFVNPFNGGAKTLRDLIPQRWKEYQIVKRWDFEMRQKRDGILYNAHVPDIYDEASEVTRRIKYYHKFKSPLKVTYTNVGGDQVDGPNYFLICNVWDEAGLMPSGLLSPAAADDPSLAMQACCNVYFTDRD